MVYHQLEVFLLLDGLTTDCQQKAVNNRSFTLEKLKLFVGLVDEPTTRRNVPRIIFSCNYITNANCKGANREKNKKIGENGKDDEKQGIKQDVKE